LHIYEHSAGILSREPALATSPFSPKATLVQRFPLFAGISLPDCANIVSVAREKHFSRRQTIFAQGDPVRQILPLVSGCVKVTQFGQDGSEVILRLTGPGEIVGALGLCAEGAPWQLSSTRITRFSD
jgi:CRP-like cAMP-binding protein